MLSYLVPFLFLAFAAAQTAIDLNCVTRLRDDPGEIKSKPEDELMKVVCTEENCENESHVVYGCPFDCGDLDWGTRICQAAHMMGVVTDQEFYIRKVEEHFPISCPDSNHACTGYGITSMVNQACNMAFRISLDDSSCLPPAPPPTSIPTQSPTLAPTYTPTQRPPVECYNQNVTWTTAQEGCVSRQGNLVTLHNYVERDEFVAATQVENVGNAWIGLRAADDNSSLIWVDGSEVDYEFWATTPSRAPGENCVSTEASLDGMWYDTFCDLLFGYCCEYDPATLSPTLEPTRLPTNFPTHFPTVGPTISPSLSPTVHPTTHPTHLPTAYQEEEEEPEQQSEHEESGAFSSFNSHTKAVSILLTCCSCIWWTH